MRGLNKVALIGNLGKGPDIQTIDGNIPVAKFSLATTELFKDKNGQTQHTTDWRSVVLWRNLAELAGKHLQKSSLVNVEGKIKTRSYDDRDGHKRYVTEVVADPTFWNTALKNTFLRANMAISTVAGVPKRCLKTPSTRRRLIRMLAFMAFATALLLICWRLVQTCGSFRNCWGTMISKQR